MEGIDDKANQSYNLFLGFHFICIVNDLKISKYLESYSFQILLWLYLCGEFWVFNVS